MFPENRIMEMLIIGALALIFIGPKDLPIMMRRVGQFVGKMRGMANEFRASFDELARQSELEELRKEVEAMRVNQQTVMTSLTSAGGSSVVDDINQHLSAPIEGPAYTPEIAAAPPASAPEPELVKPKAAPRPRAAKPAATPAKPRKATTKPAVTKSAMAKAPGSKTRKSAKTGSEVS